MGKVCVNGSLGRVEGEKEGRKDNGKKIKEAEG